MAPLSAFQWNHTNAQHHSVYHYIDKKYRRKEPHFREADRLNKEEGDQVRFQDDEWHQFHILHLYWFHQYQHIQWT